MGWFVLFGLTWLAAAAAIAVAVRSEPAGRAELGIAAFAVFFALVSAPILLLGYANVLTKDRLAVLSSLVFATVLVLAARGAPPRARVRAYGDATVALARLPIDGLRLAVAERSVVAIGLAYCVVVLLAGTLLTIFVPNATWDGFLYHEPMVGFAIQNHGFSMVDLPMNQANQATNGYPRLCESLSLWFAIFTDKTLIELPNLAAAPPMMLGAYVLARRFGDRVTAMGWACVLLLMPQVWAQLCQTYIDVLVGFFAIAAIHCATRSPLRLRDAWLATLALLLMLGSKASALTTVPLLALLTYVRVVKHHGRSRVWATLATLGLGGALLVAAGGLVPLRNWRAFHDPLWPVALDFSPLHIHWKGLITVQELTSSTSLSQALATAYGAPVGGPEDVMTRGYGYAIAWLVAPLVVAGIVLALVRSIRVRLGHEERKATPGLAIVLVAFIACVLTTPSLNGHNARYDIHIVACAMALATWVLAQPGWQHVRPQVMAMAVALAVLPLHWMRGVGWYWVSTPHIEDVLRHPLASRVVLERPAFDVSGGAREEELHAGDCVVFDEQVGFVGALWNFHYSNRVKYVPFGHNAAFFDEVTRCNAKWVVVGESDGARQALEATRAWQYVGPLTLDTSAIYRRKVAPAP